MALDKQSILEATNGGYDVFKHFLGSRIQGTGKAFNSPFYDDTKAACYVYFDKRSRVYKFKDFGNAEYSGDCFFFVGKIFALACELSNEFLRIMEIIDHELGLGLESNNQKVDRVIRNKGEHVIKASKLPSIHDGFETAKSDLPLTTREFNPHELQFWAKYGISTETLNRYHVVAVESYKGVGKSGKSYEFTSTAERPIFGYQGLRFTKLYLPFSEPRFLFSGEKTEQYVFGREQLPIRGDILFLTGGEKDVLSLAAHGFHAISMNSETANIPKNLLRALSFRFKHLVLLYDVDETGLKSMESLKEQHKSYGLKSLRLPLTGAKDQKDISDFFALGHTGDDLRMLFMEMLDLAYEDSMAIMRTCEIDFGNPPTEPEPLIKVDEVTVGAPGNIMCVAGSEGSGKTNFLGGILSGSIKPTGAEIDTLGMTIRENVLGKGVLLYDTEQSEFQLYKNLTYIVNRAELKRPPSWFKAYCLVGISRNERMKLILESMDKYFYQFGGIHSVVIDGIGDLLPGVNEEEGSVALIEELIRIAAIYNTVVICVLHMAPSGMKLRGHLGSEVQRKAAGILLIEKDENTDTSLIKALKVRDGSPLDVPIKEFGWSKEEGRHVFLGEKGPKENAKHKSVDLKALATELYGEKRSMSSKDLTGLISSHMEIQDRRARDYIKHMREYGIIEKSSQFPGFYTLIREY